MNKNGMTLLEVMIAMSILTIVAGTLFVLSLSLQNVSGIQEVEVATQDQARQGMEMTIRELRGSAMSSINTGALPGAVITYRVATDLDGNGTAVDVSGNLELSALRTISRDTNDVNGDGRTLTQLLLQDGLGGTRVLANDLLLNEDANNDGALGGGEDTNGNGVLDRGFWFTVGGGQVQVTVQTQRLGGTPPRPVTSSLTESVEPRN